MRSLTSIGKLDKDELIEPLECARDFGKTLFLAHSGDNEEVVADLYRRFVRVDMNCA